MGFWGSVGGGSLRAQVQASLVEACVGSIGFRA